MYHALSVAILAGTLSLTLARTLLVADAVWEARGGRGIAAYVANKTRAPAAGMVIGSPAAGSAPSLAGSMAVSHNSNVGSSRSGGARKATLRCLHNRLLAMHVIASFAQISALAKYVIPASDMSCLLTHRFMMAFTLLYDAYLVLFLLAKTEVTNNRQAPSWQLAVKCWSLFWARAYLTGTAIYLLLAFPGGADDELKSCYNGIEDNIKDHQAQRRANIYGYAINNVMLVIEFGLLLALFVRPLLGQTSGSKKSETDYRKVVVRNVACTVVMVVAYAVGTFAVVLALIHISATNQVAVFCADLVPLVQGFVTLCATEIALPLGVTSFVKSYTSHAAQNVQSGECKEQQQQYQAHHSSTRSIAKNSVAVAEEDPQT